MLKTKWYKFSAAVCMKFFIMLPGRKRSTKEAEDDGISASESKIKRSEERQTVELTMLLLEYFCNLM